MVPITRDDAHVDPYETFRFRLRCNGRSVAGFREVSALKRATEVVTHREIVGREACARSFRALFAHFHSATKS